jgi:hypothetical protein
MFIWFLKVPTSSDNRQIEAKIQVYYFLADKEAGCIECGTLADKPARIFCRQSILKRGYLIVNLRLNRYGSTLK